MTIRFGEWLVLLGTVVIVVFAAVVGAMIYRKPPPVRYVYLESPLSKQGEVIFRREYCLSCHEVFANGATYGPNLDGVGSRRTKSWLAEYIRAPRSGVSVKPYRLKMPPYDKLEVAELDALVTYLQGLREKDTDNRLINPPS